MAGTRMVRTTKVSRSTPTARPNPIALIWLPPGPDAAGDREDGEGPGQDQAGGGDRRSRRADGLDDRLAERPLGRLLPDPGHDEDVVVLAQRQQEDEHEERQDEGHARPRRRCR